MNNLHSPIGYLRFKKKFRRRALFKAILLGLSCGSMSTGGVMLYQKLTATSPDPRLYLSFGLGVALLIGLAAFLILRPSEKKIARRLDKDLHLGEKVQTMLAFRQDQSDMLSLQREDTNDHLMKAPKGAFHHKWAWLNAIAPVLAAACLTVAIITPVKAVEPPPVEPEPPFELTSWQETALTELIQKVKASDMEATPKKATVDELEVLLAALRVTHKESEMKLIVIAVISNLNAIVREHNTANILSAHMTESSHVSLQNMAIAVKLLSGLEMEKTMSAAREALRVDEVQAPLQEYVTALKTLMTKASPDFPTGDGLLAALQAHESALTEILTLLPDYTRDWAQNRLTDIFEDASDAMSDGLYVQYINQQVKDMAVQTLMEIFGITEDELPEEEKDQLSPEEDTSDDDKQDEEEKGDQGAPGEGNILYGSDDVIYDPQTNAYVKYGDVINRYFAVVADKLKDGQSPDTLEQFISDYFATLYDGSDKEANE